VQLIATDNKQVIVGLGVTGLSCARYLYRKGQDFSVVDSRLSPPGLDEFKQCFPDVKIFLGEISDKSLFGASLLIVSPGVALSDPAIKRAIEQGVKVCGDIDLFMQDVAAPVIAITGSNGKSTVTTIMGEMASKAGKRVAVGGNIGVPALDLLTEENMELYVLELSSFQLERAGNLGFEVATVLNISADHMDRYPNFFSYYQAKHRVFRNCKKIVINRGDTLSKPLVSEDVKVFSFGLDKADFNGFGLLEEDGVEYLAYQFEKLIPITQLKIVGRHNIENALAALALGKAAGLAIAPMLEALQQFSGLQHRCQMVDELQGVRYYNDSKGTNVGATTAAIKGLENNCKKVVLIAGGVAKGADLSPLLPILKSHARGLVAIGEAADTLVTLCANDMSVVLASSMEAAVSEATKMSEEGDAVLLSPACASFDMYENYQQRGNAFVAAVHNLIEIGGAG
jgi:UDP-N-acetylmuramoylalanine--D-glutamate ligase